MHVCTPRSISIHVCAPWSVVIHWASWRAARPVTTIRVRAARSSTWAVACERHIEVWDTWSIFVLVDWHTLSVTIHAVWSAWCAARPAATIRHRHVHVWYARSPSVHICAIRSISTVCLTLVRIVWLHLCTIVAGAIGTHWLSFRILRSGRPGHWLWVHNWLSLLLHLFISK